MTNRWFYLAITLGVIAIGCSKSIYNCRDVERDLFSDAVKGVDMTGYQLNELYKKDWYQHDVRFDQGFNPLFVPFKYISKSGPSDSMQKLTFPTLLSIKFDFVDNNICMRHPAFIYQRDDELLNLTIDDTNPVIKAMDRWRLNIAVGGTIYQNGNMYSGSIKVLDKNGILLEQSFGETEYFELMGKMVMTWIKNSGDTVSDSLKRELIRPMTSKRLSLKLLGQSFNVKERSQEQWDLFERILKLDPDFAELRWWYANQKNWQKRNDQWKTEMMLRALESHLVVPALRESKYHLSDGFHDRFKKILSKAEKIIPNHWIYLLQSQDIKGKKINYWEARSLVDDALQRPYAYPFAHKVAEKLYDDNEYHLSAPIMLSIINSGYNPGRGYIEEFRDLFFTFYVLGYLRDSTALIQPMFQFSENKGKAALFAGYLMNEAMDFASATKFFKEGVKSSKAKQLPIEFMINNYLDAGKIDEVRNIMSSNDWRFVSEISKPAFEGRLLLKMGDIDAAKNKIRIARSKSEWDNFRRFFTETALLETQLQECSQGAVQTVDRLWANSPRSRKTYHYYKIVNHNNKEKMGAYLRVANFIFPNQAYWRNESMKYLDKSSHNPDALAKTFSTYKKMLKNDELEKIAGFQIEDNCIQLLKSNFKKYHGSVIAFYREHAWTKSKISRRQRRHRKTFLVSIINMESRLYRRVPEVGLNIFIQFESLFPLSHSGARDCIAIDPNDDIRS